MILITGLSSAHKQLTRISSTGYGNIELRLSYIPQQVSWFVDVRWRDFSIQNQRLCVSPNMLEKYRLIIPFGITVTTNDKGEPVSDTDFESGRIKIYILDADEVKQVHTNIMRRYLDEY